jgi:hypothetical protein
MAAQRVPVFARYALLLLVSAVAAFAAFAIAGSGSASANFPTCSTSNHSSFADANCADSGVTIVVRCSEANLRSGPGIDFNLHGSVVAGNNGNRWKIVFRSPAVNAGCGGLSTNEWWLAPIGWITRSALWN